MGRMYSPLRYPGGKTSIHSVVNEILKSNGLQHQAYVEPFAGGGGLALSLLFSGCVSEIHLNDLDPSIWAFWHSVLFETEELSRRILEADVTIENWRVQRETYLRGDLSNPVELGFSAFFLNRTNRSGIIKGAGVIGGLQQVGNYKIDCRFNREELAHRIERIARYKRQIHLYREDAVDFLANSEKYVEGRSLYCIDPPYYKKGSSLYTNFYRANDHRSLCEAISNLRRAWIVTYDDAPQIRELYSAFDIYHVDVNYSAHSKRVASELLISSPGLMMPSIERCRAIHSALV
jgi:DNA adenine methylase